MYFSIFLDTLLQHATATMPVAYPASTSKTRVAVCMYAQQCTTMALEKTAEHASNLDIVPSLPGYPYCSAHHPLEPSTTAARQNRAPPRGRRSCPITTP
jgi:hypothetical protein